MANPSPEVDQYLAKLPADRREALQAVRTTILESLPQGYEEGIQYGGVGYFVPHSVYPAGYHCDPKQPLPFAGLASQKNHMSIHLMFIYGDPQEDSWFREAWAKTGKKLDMGKACVRFKKLEDVPLKVIGRAIKRMSVKKYVDRYESAIKPSSKSASGKATTKTVARKSAKKKPAAPKKRGTAKAGSPKKRTAKKK